MKQAETTQEIRLQIPADPMYTPVVTLALSGLGMVLGLDVDVLGDLRTVAAECMDCLMHQAGRPRAIDMRVWKQSGALCMQFEAQERERIQPQDDLALEITRGVLETLMPEVRLCADEDGVHDIVCSMPMRG